MESVQSAPSANSNSPPVPPFLSKTYDMVDDPSTNEIVSWSSGNNSFVVWDVPEFSKVLLPKHFKHNNFSSFVRQLNTYGFRKVDPDKWEFANEGFLRDQKQLLKSIVRRKPSHVQQNQVQKSSVGSACVEVGKFGIEEEVERLKRDKNVLMQELVRLRQKQQATEHQLQNVGEKVQVMEQRQQQTMSFLAKAVQSPGFLNQLVQQQNNNSNDGGGGSNKHIQGSNKKRRLPGDDEQRESCGGDEANRQIVKYQPSINEAAQSMLRQILNRKCESVSNNLDGFLLGDALSANSLNSRDGVTMDEDSSNSAHTAMNHPQAGPSPSQGGVAAAGSWSPESDLVGLETGDGVCFDPIMAALDGSLELENDEISPVVGEGDMTELLNEVLRDQDSFWELFLTDETTLIGGDSDDILSGAVESSDMVMEQEPNEGKQQEMNDLTEQMELLSSETERK